MIKGNNMRSVLLELKLRKIIRAEISKLMKENTWPEDKIESLFDYLGQESIKYANPTTGVTDGQYGKITFMVTPKYLSLTVSKLNMAPKVLGKLSTKFNAEILSDKMPNTIVVR